jgi:hypothetical protein
MNFTAIHNIMCYQIKSRHKGYDGTTLFFRVSKNNGHADD